jgi:hypothetical protein
VVPFGHFLRRIGEFQHPTIDACRAYGFLQLLQTVGIAKLYPDDKTFVDKVCLLMKENTSR